MRVSESDRIIIEENTYYCEDCPSLFCANQLYLLSMCKPSMWLCADCRDSTPAYIEWRDALQKITDDDDKPAKVELFTYAELVQKHLINQTPPPKTSLYGDVGEPPRTLDDGIE